MSNDTKTVVNGVTTFVSRENTDPDITITADDGVVNSVSRVFQRQSSQCAAYDTKLASPIEGTGPRLAIDNRTPVDESAGVAPATQTGSPATLVGYAALEEGAYYESVDRLLGGIVAHYTLNDPTASSAALDSTGQYDGTYAGTVTKEATALALNGGTSVDFGGTGYVNLGSGTQWDFVHTSSFTVSVWVNYVDNGALEYIIANASDPGEVGFSLFLDSLGGTLGAGISNGTTRDEISGDLPGLGLNHFIFTGNGTGLELFLNGGSVGTLAYTTGAGAATFPLHIAALNANSLWGSVLDEVTISSNATDATLAIQIYEAGVA